MFPDPLVLQPTLEEDYDYCDKRGVYCLKCSPWPEDREKEREILFKYWSGPPPFKTQQETEANLEGEYSELWEKDMIDLGFDPRRKEDQEAYWDCYA